MKVRVELELDLDVDAYANDYGFESNGYGLVEAIRQALRDLGNPETYLSEGSWPGLIKVKSAEAIARF